MTHDEAMEGNTVSRREAITEVRKHGVDEVDFFQECGDHQQYNSKSVLEWLGY